MKIGRTEGKKNIRKISIKNFYKNTKQKNAVPKMTKCFSIGFIKLFQMVFFENVTLR